MDQRRLSDVKDRGRDTPTSYCTGIVQRTCIYRYTGTQYGTYGTRRCQYSTYVPYRMRSGTEMTRCLHTGRAAARKKECERTRQYITYVVRCVPVHGVRYVYRYRYRAHPISACKTAHNVQTVLPMNVNIFGNYKFLLLR